jgi:hypothetical protein
VFRKKTNAADHSLAAHVFDALRAWWTQDRIRISPREGQLLTLQAPCILEIHGELVQLTDRVVGQSEGGPYVEYCGIALKDESTCALRVQPHDGSVCWKVNGTTTLLGQHEIIVYGGHRKLRQYSGQLVE